MTVIARDVSIAYGQGPDIVRGMSLRAEKGEVTTLLGPNGCGKSTLLKGLSSLLTPRTGSIEVGGYAVHELPPRRAAQVVSVLPQHPLAPPGLTVAELVERGRHPYRRRWWQGSSPEDKKQVAEALEFTATTQHAEREVAELSGGQRQRVWLAMVLAQDTPVVLLDEPTTYLDPAYAIEILSLVRELAHEQGKTVVMVLHDLTLAGSYSDQLVVMRRGSLVAQGAPREALTVEVLREAYGLEAEVWEDPRGESPVIVPRGTISAGRNKGIDMS